MNTEDCELLENRPSLASTVESELSIDDTLTKFKNSTQEFDSLAHPEVFENFSIDDQEVYESLAYRLSEVLATLELEIEPINIREYKAAAPGEISLNSIRKSGLFRRRTAMQ